jgi:hypothetical protein
MVMQLTVVDSSAATISRVGRYHHEIKELSVSFPARSRCLEGNMKMSKHVYLVLGCVVASRTHNLVT